MNKYLFKDRETVLANFYENENLPECWSCWGSLWFDVICKKSDLNITTLESTGLSETLFLDSPIEGICFDEDDESGKKFWERLCRTLIYFNVITEWNNNENNIGFGCLQVNRGCSSWEDLVFKFSDEINDKYSIELYPNEDESFPFEKFEVISEINRFGEPAAPPKSMMPGVSIEELQGFKLLYPDYYCFNKNGDLITGSLYTRGPLETSNIQGGDDFNANRLLDNGKLIVQEKPEVSAIIDNQEKPWLDAFMNPEFRTHEMINRS